MLDLGIGGVIICSNLQGGNGDVPTELLKIVLVRCIHRNQPPNPRKIAPNLLSLNISKKEKIWSSLGFFTKFPFKIYVNVTTTPHWKLRNCFELVLKLKCLVFHNWGRWDISCQISCKFATHWNLTRVLDYLPESLSEIVLCKTFAPLVDAVSTSAPPTPPAALFSTF